MILLDDDAVDEEAGPAFTSPGFAYAACVFEGLCLYRRADGRHLIFRLDDHLRRLESSMRALRFSEPPSIERLRARVIEAAAAADIPGDGHIRLLAYVDGETRVGTRGPVRTAIFARPADERPSQRPGFHCRVSTWRKSPDTALPARIKCTANYVIGRMATIEAEASGADAPILLSHEGAVAEGATANIFILRNGFLSTPRTCDGILEGITRRTVIELWNETADHPVVERRIDRSELVDCDGAFFCGSLWELSPILSVDGLPVPADAQAIASLRKRYARSVRGEDGGRNWSTEVRLARNRRS